jgi:DNA-binding response OmpR family regulator
MPEQVPGERVVLLGEKRRELYGLAYQLEEMGWQVSVRVIGEWSGKPLEPGVRALVVEIGSASPAIWRMIADLKAATRAPVLGLCDLIRPQDLAQGLEAGIEEYVYKPLRVDELDSRMRILLSRKSGGKPPLALVEGGSVQFVRNAEPEVAGAPAPRLSINDNAKLVTLDGRKIRLSRKEYALLQFLATEPGRVFSAQEIVDHLWAGKGAAGTNDAHQYIFLLRKKVESNPRRPQVIKTVAGFGYRLDIGPR